MEFFFIYSVLRKSAEHWVSLVKCRRASRESLLLCLNALSQLSADNEKRGKEKNKIVNHVVVHKQQSWVVRKSSLNSTSNLSSLLSKFFALLLLILSYFVLVFFYHWMKMLFCKISLHILSIMFLVCNLVFSWILWHSEELVACKEILYLIVIMIFFF